MIYNLFYLNLHVLKAFLDYKSYPYENKTLTLLFTFYFLLAGGQIPQGFNYQAIVRDGSNEIIAGKGMTLTIDLYANSQTGTLLWEETHAVTSNQSGMTNTGSDNTFIGYKAGSVHQSKGGNVYIGSKAGEFATNGQQNIFIGESAGSNTTDGHTNIFIGLKAGFTSEMTWGNIFIGNEAGYNTLGGGGIQGSYNTFIGWQSGRSNVIGSNNTFVGTLSGMSTTSEYNTMLGTESGWSTGSAVTGQAERNTFLGSQSGYLNSSGSRNTYVGNGAGYSNTSGTNNTYIGTSAGGGGSTGNGNVFIGYRAGYNESGDDKLYIANNSGSTLIYGNFTTPRVGINTTAPSEVLEVNGNVKADAFIAAKGKTDLYSYNTTMNMNVPDYVFDKHFEGKSAQNPDYEMLNFTDLKQYISEKRHLPGVPSRAEIEKTGAVNLQGLSMITLEKVEENTLYILELEKITVEQQKQIENQQKEINDLKSLINRILENQVPRIEELSENN